MTGDNDTARAGLLAFLHLVNLGQTFTRVRSLELLGKLVVADAPGVHDRVGWQDVLSYAAISTRERL